MVAFTCSFQDFFTTRDGNTQSQVTKRYTPSWFKKSVFEALFDGVSIDEDTKTITFDIDSDNALPNDMFILCSTFDREDHSDDPRFQTIFTHDEHDAFDYFENWRIDHIMDEFHDLLTCFFQYDTNGENYDRASNNTYFVIYKHSLSKLTSTSDKSIISSLAITTRALLTLTLENRKLKQENKKLLSEKAKLENLQTINDN